ncbi:malto-oligosyltrehalose trehalohydrolase [Larkinella bovis]|uniref:Malto-oligosyltrehalose trehalohydrolase n=1 Tax=Larkinella bovis TaxID=683041 RepID=A0ABW0I7X8_9BACT
MHESPVSQRSLGLTFQENGTARVVVWAPLADTVDLVLCDQSGGIRLEKQPFGYWETTTPQLKPGDRYRFRLNGTMMRPDPASLSQPEGVHGPSEAVDTTHFQWTDQHWTNHNLEQYILYELHTGTFTPEGTFAGIIQKLDYLKGLGISVIEIMPVAQFPGSRNWGYDGVYPFAVQNSYGGPRGLQQLVDACHQKGLAVVLDVVYNHFGPEGNYFPDFGPYLTSKYCTPWGDAVNFDDAWCDGVRRYFLENALMWFRDFHIDALRLDAVHAIKDFSPTHILQDIREQLDQLMATTGRRHYLIIENDLNDPRFLDPLTQRGYGMDAQWTDEFHHALRVSAGEKRKGYYSDFNGIDHLTKSYQDAYVFDGQFSAHRNRFFGRKASTQPGRQFIVFSQNHDQVGNRMLGERTSQLVSVEMQKLLAGAVLVSPYLPLLFMGEEWSAPHPFLYFVSHTDPALAEAVRQGRRQEFGDFHAQGDVPDPVAEETFQQSKLQWDLIAGQLHQTLLRYYQALIALRKAHPALHHLNRQQLQVVADEKRQTIQLYRWHGEHHVLCVLNFAKEPQSLPLLAGEHGEKLFDSADPQWQLQATSDASGDKATASSPTEILVIQPESLVIYGTPLTDR